MKTAYIALVAGVILLTGCNTPITENTKDANTNKTYDQTSRQNIIPETCQSFFDGCNQCSRIGDNPDDVACTRMYCETYTKPYCTDDQADKTDTQRDETAILPDAYIGLTIAKAQSLADESDQLFRVVQIDGEPQIVTMDYVPGRLNVTVTSGMIIAIEVE